MLYDDVRKTKVNTRKRLNKWILHLRKMYELNVCAYATILNSLFYISCNTFSLCLISFIIISVIPTGKASLFALPFWQIVAACNACAFFQK